MDLLLTIASALVAALLGALVTGLAMSRARSRLQAERDHWQAQAELAQQNCRAAELETATLTERANRAGELAGELDATRRQTERLLEENRTLTANAARLQATLTSESRAAEDKIKSLTQAMTQAKDELGQQFARIADEILHNRTQQIQQQQQQSLSTLLGPVKTKLEEFQARVDAVHQEDTKASAALSREIQMLAGLNRQIAQDAKNLTQALKGDNKAQGIWGEVILERLLELSGLVRGREYDTQVAATLADGEGSRKIQPDVLLHLPEGRHLIIDAKVSLVAFERYASAEDDQSRQAALREHIASIQNHIKSLSAKDYPSMPNIRSVDYTILFLASEPAFLVAIEHDKTLFDEAWRRNVMLVCPSTLLFVLRMIDHLWRLESQADNAKTIFDIARQLYDKFSGFYQNFEAIGAALDRASKAYDNADKQLKGRGSLYRQISKLTSEKLITPKKPLPLLESEADGEIEEGRIESLSRIDLIDSTDDIVDLSRKDLS